MSEPQPSNPGDDLDKTQIEATRIEPPHVMKNLNLEGLGPGQSVPTQDLSGDKMILAAPRVNYMGRVVPALGGIPLLSKLGQGGMGAVYYGIHPRLNKEIAIKVLPFHLAEQQPDMVKRFFREAQIAAMVQSPHLVSAMDVNEEKGLVYLVMEYVNGESAGMCLRRIKQAGGAKISEAIALDICIAAAKGLAGAHGVGIIHRDIKPDNILIPKNRATNLPLYKSSKLADLGLARGEDLGQSLTMGQACMGTPGYMSPEQALDAKSVGKPADVFSLGATLYALLSFNAPFTGSSAMKIVMDTAQTPHVPIKNLRPEVSAQTAALIDRCLQKQADKRFGDADDLLDALKAARTALENLAGTIIRPKSAPLAPPSAANNTGGPAAIGASGNLGACPSLDLGGGVTLALAQIPAGEFLMGSPPSEVGRSANEIQHKVTLTRPVFMSSCQITQTQYQQVMGVNPSEFTDPDNPVENVSWDDAQEFCRRVSAKTGKLLRLPTEAEWEHACRAGTTTPFHFGDTISVEQANYDGNFTYGNGQKGIYRQKTTPAGSFPPNNWGLHDMHANIWEWCQDWYAPYTADAVTDPRGPETGKFRVMRGGSWNYRPALCRSATRYWDPPHERSSRRGFRVVCI
jgi:formylglycine-generating enzyme required for sulfatase activity/tRNA A-37 threonylcarbamoyl transferase component Bud32